MFTKFTTTLMAGALALASAATPTELRAGNDTGKIVAGIAVGAIIGAAIASNNKTHQNHGGQVSRGRHDAYDGGYQRGYNGGYSGGHQRGHNSGYNSG